MTVAGKMISMWLSTAIVGSLIFSFLWTIDAAGSTGVSLIDNWEGVGIFCFAAAGLSMPGIILYFFLRPRVYAHNSIERGRVYLSVIGILLILLTGFYPLYILCGISGMGPTTNHGSGYIYDQHYEHYFANLLYFLVSYSIPFVTFIFLFDRRTHEADTHDSNALE
jgi:hypothetical protein